MMNKRGISPLIATLLLISFAIAIGVVVMNFGQAQVELEAKCPINIGLKLSKISGEKQFCYDADKKEISFNVENGVNINVEGLVVNVIGSQQAQSFELNDAKITKAGVYDGKVSYDSSSGGELRQIKITPKIVLHDNEEICTDKALVVEEIRPC
ncbi:hypothetical protein HOA91_05320 [Candidatus Woesearchaeota archaeon]|jgi:flagellin-like protein|nr:hypothetical protein [Candidatus Woesearchaeota archaeon]